MKRMIESFSRKSQICKGILCLAVFVSVATAWAAPTFQVYVDGGTANSIGADEDTWFTSSSSFDLIVVGAYGSKTDSLSQVTLAVSAPQGQTGTLTINGASLLTTKTSVLGGYYNPNVDANTDILTNIAGIDGYSTKSFLPSSQQLSSNHYPFQDDVSNFVLFAVGDFSNTVAIHNYDADSGSTDLSGFGQEKVFHVEAGGFEWLHFDVYGYETDLSGASNLKTTWDENPGSHDSTYTASVVPVPSALMLAGIGLSCLWKMRKQW